MVETSRWWTLLALLLMACAAEALASGCVHSKPKTEAAAPPVPVTVTITTTTTCHHKDGEPDNIVECTF